MIKNIFTLIKKNHSKKKIWFLLVLVLIFLDQASKYVAVYYLSNQYIEVLPWMNFLLAFNYGSAFSLFSDQELWQKIFLLSVSSLISVAIFIWMLCLPRKKSYVLLSLSLILGGAIGNLWDRIEQGYVIDFIHMYYKYINWPIFNLADMFISIGAITLIVLMYFDSKKNKIFNYFLY